MNKTMLEVTVYTTNDGNIGIQSTCDDVCNTIVISPDQAETLNKWLLEARSELTREKRD